ncbi:thioredoxin family protein [Nocardia arthritidis]|nr:thioredoxin domain-containing protein [Nocardia arthritidis]
MALKSVTNQSFDFDVLASDMPVAVHFYADWSEPCTRIGPILEAIARDYGDQLGVVRLNIDQNPATAKKYGVVDVPTINVYRGGEVVKTIVGAKPKAAIERELSPFIDLP